MDVTKNRISNERFERLKLEGKVFGELKMIMMKKLYNRLADDINYRLLPVIENVDVDSELELENTHHD